MSKLLIALAAAAFILIAACSDPGKATSMADRNDIVVTVEWQAPDEVDATCKAAGATDGEHFEACAASGATACTIYAVEPRSFSDHTALKALGHEAWHCFGARH